MTSRRDHQGPAAGALPGARRSLWDILDARDDQMATAHYCLAATPHQAVT
jgi:hypothetical protein